MSTSNGLGDRRTRPTIWLKQIVLYKSIKPVEEIRKIPFTVGLNIIQGESNDSTDAFETGHGNGKTTLCRLIRYCLGEESFGQDHVVKEVKHGFPTGYVGAVFEVGGEEWSVLRSLGHRGKESAKKGVDLVGLHEAEDALPYSDFEARLEEVGLGALPRRDVLSGGHSIQWLHLLALCSRDQESRYDRFWHWRDPRSDSGNSRLFAKPKLDASLCVRSILGLLDSNEPGFRKRLEEIDDELETLRTKIKEKAAEPKYHVTRMRSLLADKMGVPEAIDAPLEPGHVLGVGHYTDTRLQGLRDELAQIDLKIPPLDRQINIATSQYRELLELQEQQQAAKDVTEDGTAVLISELDRQRNLKDWLEEKWGKECKPGRILFGDCDLVKANLADIEQKIADEQSKVLKQVAERDQVSTKLDDQAKRHDDPLTRLRERLDELNRQKNDLVARRRVVSDLLDEIPRSTADLLKWHRIASGEETDGDFAALQGDEAKLLSEQVALKSQLNGVLTAQNTRAKEFGKRFNEIVKQTITPDYKGAIVIDNDEISFRINRERSLAGEAYETLAVLLADIAILLESATPSTCHPGLLIHDSPREADLYIRLYQRMLDMAQSLMSEKNGEVAYQYIVTTTTRPSEPLRAPSITKVTLSSGPGSLFGRQLESPGSDQKTLFDETEET